MKLDWGTIIAVAAALLFYLRLIILQRQRVKRHYTLQQMQKKTPGSKGQKKAAPAPPPVEQQLGYKIVSWYLIGAGILIILIGALASNFGWFPPVMRTYWWVIVVAGIAVLNMGIR